MKCFNTFRSENEAKLAESEALKNMKFSPRLFEIKLFQRHESVAYYSDPDIFILAEGDAVRCYNFSTGQSIINFTFFLHNALILLQDKYTLTSNINNRFIFICKRKNSTCSVQRYNGFKLSVKTC